MFETAMANLNEIMSLLHGMNEHGSFPAIDIDLALEKTRNLYDVLLLLRQNEDKQTGLDHSYKTTEQNKNRDEGPLMTTPEQETSKDEIFEIAREMPDEPKPSVKARAEKKEEKKILSDSLKGKAILGESLHQNIQYQDLSTHMHTKPITDLAKAIGINEKYLFIRELFANDTRKFEEAIQTINHARNFNEAYTYMSREFDWDMDSELVQSLLEIVRRKFITRQHE
jgi:hypothetical protein